MRLATWNLLHGRSITDGRVVTERLAEGARLLDADVLGLQEVDRGQARSGGRDLTAEVAEASGAVAWRFVPAVVGTPGEQWRGATERDEAPPGAHYGIGLVSRYPVRSWHVVRLPAASVKAPVLLPGSSQVVWLQDEPRLALAAVVETPHGVMTVATAHLSFVPGWNGAQLRKVTAALARLPGPRVLVADLNMPPPFPRLLTGWRALARTPTYPSSGARVQLDHVLASGTLPPVTAVTAPTLPVSDHCALAVDLG
ncbi:MAG: Endonuclease/exonuclease/phosphatase [Frankiales bacterium]|nr:Endonuclease/exonuclease/phosphatase [Frankiales bacterium]